MTFDLVDTRGAVAGYVFPVGSQRTRLVMEYVETVAESPATSERLSAIASKYRAIRESMPKRQRSGDATIRLAELEANKVSIREAENLRK